MSSSKHNIQNPISEPSKVSHLIEYLPSCLVSLQFPLAQVPNFCQLVIGFPVLAIALGFSVVALEFGYIYIYRVGWNVSTGSLVANISLACVLLIIGVFIYKENISFHQILGMALCTIGLLLVTK